MKRNVTHKKTLTVKKLEEVELKKIITVQLNIMKILRRGSWVYMGGSSRGLGSSYRTRSSWGPESY